MERNEIITKLKKLKPELAKEGIILIGFFGSYARGDNQASSDIDLLYSIKDPAQFAKKYGIFGSFAKLQEIKEHLSKEFGTPIDLVAESSLNEIGKKYIFKDLINV